MVLKKITDLSTDPAVRNLLHQLDLNQDDALDTSEVSREDGYLKLPALPAAWTPQQQMRVQKILLEQNFAPQEARVRRAMDTITWNHDTAEHPVIEEQMVQLEGRPSAGRVLFLRQAHKASAYNMRIMNPSTPAVDPDKKEQNAVSDYQLRILRFLCQRRPRHVFLEGLDADIPPHAPVPLRNKIRKAFLEGDAQDPEIIECQRSFLYKFGAGAVYYVLFSDVVLHRTIEKTDADALFSKLEDPSLPDEDRTALIMDAREEKATRQVMNFLQHKNDVEVAIIYGAAHELADDFARFGRFPSVESIMFRGMRETIRRAPVPILDFPLLDTEHQYHALDALDMSSPDWASRHETVLDFLLKNSKSDTVRAKATFVYTPNLALYAYGLNFHYAPRPRPSSSTSSR